MWGAQNSIKKQNQSRKSFQKPWGEHRKASKQIKTKQNKTFKNHRGGAQESIQKNQNQTRKSFQKPLAGAQDNINKKTIEKQKK